MHPQARCTADLPVMIDSQGDSMMRGRLIEALWLAATTCTCVWIRCLIPRRPCSLYKSQRKFWAAISTCLTSTMWRRPDSQRAAPWPAHQACVVDYGKCNLPPRSTEHHSTTGEELCKDGGHVHTPEIAESLRHGCGVVLIGHWLGLPLD